MRAPLPGWQSQDSCKTVHQLQHCHPLLVTQTLHMLWIRRIRHHAVQPRTPACKLTLALDAQSATLQQLQKVPAHLVRLL